MINIKADVDSRRMIKALDDFKRMVGDDAGELIANESKLFFRAAMSEVIPRGLGSAAKKQGEASVEKQVKRAAPGFDVKPKSGYTMAAMARTKRTGDISHVNKAMAKQGFSERAAAFTPDVHRRARNDRGRVPKTLSTSMVATEKDKRARDLHIKAKKKNVGMMKAAFAYGIELVNRKTKIPTRVPAWIKRNITKSVAWLKTVVSINLRGGKTSVELKTGTHPEAIQGIRRAMNIRVRAMARKARNLVEGRAKIFEGRYEIIKNDRET